MGDTFDQDKAFYSKARQGEVMAKVQTQANNSGRAIEELKDLYLQFTKRIAECGELTLLEETINGKRASLVYARKETCDTASKSQGREIIEMIDEGGWKIIGNLTRMSG